MKSQQIIHSVGKRLSGVLKKHKKAVVVSLCNTLLLTIFSYFLNNQPLFTGEDLLFHTFTGFVKAKFGLEKKQVDDDVLFINIGYDNQLIDKYNDTGVNNEPLDESDELRQKKVGNTTIVDRSKLLKLLKLLEKCDYKYICLDVLFEKGYEDKENDSLLYAQIKKMRDIVIPYDDIKQLADSSLINKAGYSEHLTTIVSTNYIRYPLTKDCCPSISAFPYYELTENRIEKYGPFYTCAGRLCYNSIFLHFPIDPSADTEKFQRYSNGNQNYFHLGSEMLNDTAQLFLRANGYIFVGDFVNSVDLHDTYAGKKPGVYINYCAFKALMEGEHFYKWWLAFFLGIIYFLIFLSFFSKKSVFQRIPYLKGIMSKLPKLSNFFKFLTSLIGYTLLLECIEITLNIFCDVSISILLPSIYFAIFKTILKYKKLES